MGQKEGKPGPSKKEVETLIEDQLKMKNWDIQLNTFKCYPGLVFFAATEPDSFAHDRGDNVEGGIVDVKSNTAYKAHNKAVASILATSLNEKHFRGGNDLPPLTDLLHAESMLYMHGGYYITGFESRSGKLRPVNEGDDEPRVERNAEGWIELKYQSYTVNEVPDPVSKNTKTFNF